MATDACENILIVIFLQIFIIWSVQGMLEYHETNEDEEESEFSKSIAAFMEIF